jgi:hypothetical protein
MQYHHKLNEIIDSQRKILEWFIENSIINSSESEKYLLTKDDIPALQK